MGVGAAQKEAPVPGSQPLSQTLVIPVSQDPQRLSPTGQKMLPTIFGYVSSHRTLLSNLFCPSPVLKIKISLSLKVPIGSAAVERNEEEGVKGSHTAVPCLFKPS